MRRGGALLLAVLGQVLLASLDPALAALPALVTFTGAAMLIADS